MRLEKGDGLVVEISMKCNCDCNKKHNEDNFENEMLDKDGVLDLISSFEDYILDVNRYARFTRKKVEIERTSGEMIDIIKDFEKTYSLKENKQNGK